MMKHKDEPLWVTKERKKKRIKRFVAIAVLAGGVVLAKKTGFVDQVVAKITADAPKEKPNGVFYLGEEPGEPNEERIFEVGEHELVVRRKQTEKIDFDSEVYKIEDNVFFKSANGNISYILVNIVPVQCTADENGDFSTFGIPVLEEELGNVKTK